MKTLLRPARTVPPDHAPFAALPIRRVVLGNGASAASVHMRGTLRPGSTALVCVAGYERNMSDFAELAARIEARLPGAMVLVDLPGRGRSDDRSGKDGYSSLSDARDLSDVLTAVGVGRAVFLGQGYGGQVVMALAAAHPLRVAGTVLVDAGPMTDSRGIVRLRTNVQHVAAQRGLKATMSSFERILSATYPEKSEAALEGLALRSHWLDKRGRARPLFDMRLIEAIKDIRFDDVLMAQWPLFDALRAAPLLLLRTQFTDQLRRETFDEMVRRRPDAEAHTIVGQGAPALFDDAAEVDAIARFVVAAGDGLRRAA